MNSKEMENLDMFFETNDIGPAKVLQGGFINDTLRTWQSRTSNTNPDCLIFPVFISYQPDLLEEISSLPGQYRVGVNRIKEYLQPVVENGLKTVLLFGVVDSKVKSCDGRAIFSKDDNPVYGAIQKLKENFSTLTIACDLCLCGYTDHGHCGVINEDDNGHIDNKSTLSYLKHATKLFVGAGAHIIAPSDMADKRIKAINDVLISLKYRDKVAIMSYSAKFASSFYGPFRDAVGSSPSFGDRKKYQLPPGSSGLAIRAVNRDIEEGADILMVKPGMPYLDIVKDIKTMHPEYPLAIYQVSGEYAMIHHASQNGAVDRKRIVMESLSSMHRAGADIIISYFTPEILKWLKE